MFWATKIQADHLTSFNSQNKNYLFQAEALAIKQNDVDFLVELLNDGQENLTIVTVRIIQEVHNGSMSITRINSNHFEIVLVFRNKYKLKR